ncbi:MAG: FKBP-type peptidyl-prolyl cis-trans isomerase [Desulfobacteraceae bacterium]|nr:FKBP-type peptidyl-prolyl cis-trans isomerase [Desulfobacteraceae bacterium]
MQKSKIYLLALMFLVLFNFQVFANEKKEQSMEKEDLEKQISYALGYDITNNLKANFKFNPEFFMMGVKDNVENTPKLTEDKLKEILISFQQLARQKQMDKVKKESKANQAEGIKFLEENKKNKDVVTLASGLQYKVITKGEGPLPTAEDTVECHYKGTLIDGTVFDSSYRRGKSATFQVGGVIQGWIEALQKMKVGSKWMLFIPPELAYGDRGAGAVIKPGSTLIFEVELLSIIK